MKSELRPEAPIFIPQTSSPSTPQCSRYSRRSVRFEGGNNCSTASPRPILGAKLTPRPIMGRRESENVQQKC